jgi:hypothetical protein
LWRALTRGRAIQKAWLGIALYVRGGTDPARLKELFLSVEPPRSDASFFSQLTLLN